MKNNEFIYLRKIKRKYLSVYSIFKMTSYTLGHKVIAPTKPERGVFPLDHEGRMRE